LRLEELRQQHEQPSETQAKVETEEADMTMYQLRKAQRRVMRCSKAMHPKALAPLQFECPPQRQNYWF